MSSRGTALAIAAAFGLLGVGAVFAQYPGEVKKKDNAPTLRAVGVLEWTGEPGKPKKSRLVPITVFDGQQLQDGGEYLARPEPMAIDGGVEYVLQQDGKKVGLFDIDSSGQEQGSWVGLGSWKPLPVPRKPSAVPAPIDVDDTASDTPVLHRKHHAGDSTTSGSGSDSGAHGSTDPDRPTLHKKTSGDDSGSSTTTSAPAPDPDRPTLHKAPASGNDSDNAQASNAKGAPPRRADADPVESLPDVTDPDRPRLMRGKPTSDGPAVAPTLMGLPEDMQQMVAVSDSQNRPEHPWVFSWANPEDQDKLKAQLEDMARTALGLQAPPAPVSKARSKTSHAKTRAVAAPEPAPLEDEQFRVFELAYGSGATLVLTAQSGGSLAEQRFVTLIAQPDLYGSLLVLFKHVTDGAHLEDNPRMRLIDAVDAMADNRGELLFELRGKTQRQFVLYRVLRGNAEKLFVTDALGEQAMN